MSIENKITINTGCLNRTARTIRSVAAAAALAYITTVSGGCLLDATGTGRFRDVSVGQVDAGTQPTDLDHPQEDGGIIDAGSDGGTDGGTDGGDAGCVVPDNELPTTVYNPVNFDANSDNLEQDILNYRLPADEGSLTFGQLFDNDAAIGYGEHGFADMYRQEQGMKDALANDLGERIGGLLCISEVSDIWSSIGQLFREVLDDGDDLTDFRLAGDNSVYFVRAVGNDDIQRSYMIMIGAVLPTDGQTSGTPTVLYLSGMDETFDFVQAYTEGGI